MPNVIVPVGPSTWKLPASLSGFSVATPPAPTAATTALLRPNWTAGPSGWDPYRQLDPVVLDGYAFFANGHDQPAYWDRAGNKYDMGSDVATGFNIAEDAGGADTFATGVVLRYRLVFRNSTLRKETAPQETASTPGYVEHTLSQDADIDITWTDPGGEFDEVAIYRQLQGDALYVLIDTVAAAAETYTDTDAVGTIETNEPYTRRYRTTKPPKFKRVVSHLNRIWGFTGEDSFLYYGQQVSTSLQGEFLIDDFPSGNFLEIAPSDGDVIVHVVKVYGRLYVFKRRAVYVVSGEDPLSFRVDEVFRDRGLIAPGALTMVNNLWYFLDEKGAYFTDLRGEPFVAGAADGTATSPLAPIWERLNQDAAEYFRAVHDKRRGLVIFHVALDHSPVADTPIVFDTRSHRFVSIDGDGIPAFAAGYLEDAAGVERLARVDDLLHLFQDEAGNSDGVYDGDLVAGTISSVGTRQELTTTASFSLDSLDGADGAPFERYDTNGNVVDSNRVGAISSDTVQPLYWSSATPTVNDQLALGTIPMVLQLAHTDYRTSEKVRTQTAVLQTLVESGGLLRVDTKTDEDAFENKEEIDLSAAEGQHRISLDDHSWRWTMRLTARTAGVTVRLLAIDIEAEDYLDRE